VNRAADENDPLDMSLHRPNDAPVDEGSDSLLDSPFDNLTNSREDSAAGKSALELQAALEAMIYAADEPATLDQLTKAAGVEKDLVRAALEQLLAAFQTEDRGVEIRKVANGYKMYTKPQHHDAVRRFIKSLRAPLRLSLPALETLAVIAYKQPVTVPEISEIRGVNCACVIGTLLERKLVTTAGRKEVIGRPILYRTSKEFLLRFGLADVDDLPSLKEFEQLAQAALGADDGLQTDRGLAGGAGIEIVESEPDETGSPESSAALVEALEKAEEAEGIASNASHGTDVIRTS
jgi:segregation and condensation protein B